MNKIGVIAYTDYLTDARVRREAEGLAKRSDTVDVFCLSCVGQMKEEVVDGVVVMRLPISRYRGSSSIRYILSYVWFTILAAWHVSVRHFGNSYDVIHVHNMPDFVVFSALLAKLLGAKIVLDIHDLMPETFAAKFEGGISGLLWHFTLWEERVCTTFADHVITTTGDPYRRILIERGLAAEKVSVVMNVPDDKIFVRRSDWDSPTVSHKGQHFLLVYHGTIVYRRGLDIATRAVASLKGKIPGLRFRIIGEGDFLPELRQLIRDLDADDVIELMDHLVPVDQLTPLLAKADLAIIPNRLTSSTRHQLPAKLLEYVYLGIPVVASRMPAIQQHFDPTMVHFFEPGDADELAACIEELYSSPGQRRRLAKAANKFVQRRNWQTEQQTLYGVIDALVQSKSTTTASGRGG